MARPPRWRSRQEQHKARGRVGCTRCPDASTSWQADSEEDGGLLLPRPRDDLLDDFLRREAGEVLRRDGTEKRVGPRDVGLRDAVHDRLEAPVAEEEDLRRDGDRL